ncbi:hypothetical protein KDD93_04665 [Campylobacter sp. faydin G-24]|uniref:Uncharacterized protein n=1 Tax=Campylobacter anatolicus TaxID=2829105 RepID=A0ABS5HHV8_9BACT|nr:hypothetical protein [Campylobacter anatolicus]MBR8462922.1 hypothetical protein [Campylobacter anatolicus]MBR8463869.1 hypothetical protein [Campylobacter anatolicus]
MLAIQNEFNKATRLDFNLSNLDVRDLYTDTGKLNTSVSLILEAKSMNDEELNELEFKTIIIKQDDKFVSLKELGATAISKIVKNNDVKF